MYSKTIIFTISQYLINSKTAHLSLQRKLQQRIIKLSDANIYLFVSKMVLKKLEP